MSAMNHETVDLLAQEVLKIFEEHGLESERFNLVVIVPQDYYESIRRDFSAERINDISFGVRRDNWTIGFRYMIPRKF